jgi:hypothetical protein
VGSGPGDVTFLETDAGGCLEVDVSVPRFRACLSWVTGSGGSDFIGP